MRSWLKFGGKILFYYCVQVILSLLFLSMVGGDNMQWLQVLLNVLLLAGFGALMLNDGGYAGEKAVTLSATLDKQIAEGRTVDPKMDAMRWSVKTGVIGYAVAVLPVLLIALINLAVLPMYPQTLVPYEPSEAITDAELQAAAYESLLLEEGMLADATPAPGTDADAALEADAAPADEAEPAEAVPVNWFNVVARLTFMPFVSLYTLLSHHLMALFILFVPLSFVMPAFSLAGYLAGPRLRQKKLAEIKKGKRRKMRNLKVNKKPRKPNQPKPEV